MNNFNCINIINRDDKEQKPNYIPVNHIAGVVSCEDYTRVFINNRGMVYIDTNATADEVLKAIVQVAEVSQPIPSVGFTQREEPNPNVAKILTKKITHLTTNNMNPKVEKAIDAIGTFMNEITPSLPSIEELAKEYGNEFVNITEWGWIWYNDDVDDEFYLSILKDMPKEYQQRIVDTLNGIFGVHPTTGGDYDMIMYNGFTWDTSDEPSDGKICWNYGIY